MGATLLYFGCRNKASDYIYQVHLTPYHIISDALFSVQPVIFYVNDPFEALFYLTLLERRLFKQNETHATLGVKYHDAETLTRR